MMHRIERGTGTIRGVRSGMTKRFLWCLALAAVGPAHLTAQTLPAEEDVVERLVAVVGDSVVVQTQVVEEIDRMRLQGAPVPQLGSPEYEELFGQVLEQFVDRLIVLQAAAKDSLLQVDESTIEEQVEEQIQRLVSEFGGQASLQQALAAEAMTLTEYRESLRVDARTRRIQQLFYQSRIAELPPIEVTEEEMLAAFQEARGTLQQRPKLITFRQVVVAPEPSDAAKDTARVEAEALLARVEGGEDFAELARVYSDDPGSAQVGGELGWFRRGRMVREFEEAAFDLYAGQVTDVVESSFGFHIIKVERDRPGERFARHILVRPELTDDDVERGRTLVRDLMQQARDGANMRDLWEEYSDQESPDSMTFAFDQISELPPAYTILRTTPAGDVRGPIEYDLQGETRLAFVLVEEVREAGAYTFEDLRGQIAGALQQEKQIEQLVESLRAATYVHIPM